MLNIKPAPVSTPKEVLLNKIDAEAYIEACETVGYQSNEFEKLQQDIFERICKNHNLSTDLDVDPQLLVEGRQ